MASLWAIGLFRCSIALPSQPAASGPPSHRLFHERAVVLFWGHGGSSGKESEDAVEMHTCVIVHSTIMKLRDRLVRGVQAELATSHSTSIEDRKEESQLKKVLYEIVEWPASLASPIRGDITMTWLFARFFLGSRSLLGLSICTSRKVRQGNYSLGMLDQIRLDRPEAGFETLHRVPSQKASTFCSDEAELVGSLTRMCAGVCCEGPCL